MFSSRKIIVVGILLFIALFLRLYKLADIPSGFQNDEVSFFLNAVSIKETGMDEDGHRFPIFLSSFIDPKPALFSYLQIPLITLFGETKTAARMPSVIFGILSLVVLYYLLQTMTTKRVAVIATILVTISPWHILVSRSTQEVIMSFFFSLCSIWFFQLLRKKVTISRMTLFFIATVLAMYSYHSAKVALPLILLSMTLAFHDYSGRNIRLPWKHIAGIFLTALAGIYITIFVFSGSLERFRAVSIFTDKEPQLILDEQIRAGTPYLPGFILRAFHNKVVNYGRDIIRRYAAHYTVDFLYLNGGEPQRYKIPSHGLLYLIELPLLLCGLYCAIRSDKRTQRTTHIFMMFWLLAAAVPDAIAAQEHPSIIRTFMMIVPMMWFTTIGLERVFQLFSGKVRLLLASVIVVSYVGSMLYFENQFVIQQPIYRPWTRNYADEALATLLSKVGDNYKRILLTTRVSGQPYVYLALARAIPLQELQQQPLLRKQDSFTVGKVTFLPSDCTMRFPTTESTNSEPIVDGTLFITSSTCQPPEGYEKVGEATYKDGAGAYTLYTFKGIFPKKK